MTRQQRTNVFVSYSSHDGALVAPIVKLLRANRTLVFQDVDSIQPGKRWRVELDKALNDSNMVVLFWCQHSSQSSEVKKEWQAAIDQEKDLLPLLFDDTLMPKELSEFEWIDFREAYGPNHACIAKPEEKPDKIYRKTQSSHGSMSPNVTISKSDAVHGKSSRTWLWVTATGMVAGLALGINFSLDPGSQTNVPVPPLTETTTEPDYFPQSDGSAMSPGNIMVISLSITITIALIVLWRRRGKSKYKNSCEASKLEAEIASKIEAEIFRRTTR